MHLNATSFLSGCSCIRKKRHQTDWLYIIHRVLPAAKGQDRRKIWKFWGMGVVKAFSMRRYCIIKFLSKSDCPLVPTALKTTKHYGPSAIYSEPLCALHSQFNLSGSLFCCRNLKKKIINEILCNFIVWILQYLKKIYFCPKKV